MTHDIPPGLTASISEVSGISGMWDVSSGLRDKLFESSWKKYSGPRPSAQAAAKAIAATEGNGPPVQMQEMVHAHDELINVILARPGIILTACL